MLKKKVEDNKSIKNYTACKKIMFSSLVMKMYLGLDCQNNVLCHLLIILTHLAYRVNAKEV